MLINERLLRLYRTCANVNWVPFFPNVTDSYKVSKGLLKFNLKGLNFNLYIGFSYMFKVQYKSE